MKEKEAEIKIRPEDTQENYPEGDRFLHHELESREKLLSAILDGIRAAIVIIDPQTHKVIRCNPIALELFAVDADNMTGRDCRGIDLKAIDGSGRTLGGFHPDTVYRDIEARLKRSDGTIIPLRWNVLPVKDDKGPLLVEIFFDITERKKLERQLEISRKLESIGSLASGIAHEINTPIQYISDSISFLSSVYSDLEELREKYESLLEAVAQGRETEKEIKDISRIKDEIDLDFLLTEAPKSYERITAGIERVANIVRAMKNFAHPGGEGVKSVDINRSLSDIVTVAKNEWKYCADLELDLTPNLAPIPGHAGPLNQVFLNLLVNSAHALTDKLAETGEKGLIRIGSRLAQDYVEIFFSDTGTGIPPQIQNRIFDPFFTTKEVGKGTGQGLTIVHEIIVNRHNGSIDLKSTPGEGTTFTIRLPLKPSAEQKGANGAENEQG